MAGADKQAFDRDGVAGPFPLHDPASAARVLSIHSTLNSKRNQHAVSGEIQALIGDVHLVHMVRRLCGEDYLVWRSAFFYKGPGSQELGWHHDKHYQSAAAPEVRFDEIGQHISVLIALHDIDAGNGQLEIIPGSHVEDERYRRDPRPYNQRPAGAHFLADIPPALLETRRSIDMPAAHFIIFHSALLHRSLEHRGGPPRLGFAIRLAHREAGVPADLASGADIAPFAA